jgi:CARDB protein
VLLLAVALGALPLGPEADAIELTVEGPTVEDARESAPAGRASEVGDELFIRCRLTAQGTGAPDEVSFVFRIDGSVVRELTVPLTMGAPIAIGQYWTPATPGAHDVACEVNPDRKVKEESYADNVRQRTVMVRPRGSTPATATAPSQAAPAPKPVAPPPPTPPSAAPNAPAPPATGPPASAATPPGMGPAAPAKPDLAILAVTTIGDPGCGPKEPSLTARVTVKNVGEAVFVPPRNSTLLETTVKIANETTLTGRKAIPQLAPGASAELEVVARSRTPLPDAGGLRYSVVVIVNGDSKVEEVTLDNNGEYVKAVFPHC